MKTTTKISKKFTSAAMAAFLGLALIGCGGEPEPSSGLEEFGITLDDLQEMVDEVESMSPEEIQAAEDAANDFANQLQQDAGN